jgi:hypothetical protein
MIKKRFSAILSRWGTIVFVTLYPINLIRAKIKIQKVQRPTNKSFYVNMPAAIAEALELEKGEEFEWTIEDKNTLVLKRVNPLEIDVRINSK